MSKEELEIKNVLPNGWAYAVLEDISDVDKHSIKRGPFGSALKKSFFVPEGYKVYEQGNVINNDFDRGSYFIDEEKYEELKSFSIKPKDILMSCAGTVGKLAIVPEEVQEGVINQALLKLSVHPDIDLQYFFKLFSYQIDEILKDNLRGSAMMNLTSVKDLKLVRFPIAPLNEQKRIVTKIEKLFSNLDSSNKYLVHLEKQLKRYRQSVLKSAFEGELTKEWREKQTNLESADSIITRIKKDRLLNYENSILEWENEVKNWKAGLINEKPRKPKKLKDFVSLTDGELKELPSLNVRWQWVKIDTLLSFEENSIKAGPFGSSLKKSFYTESGYKIYGQEQVIANDAFLGDYYVGEDKYKELGSCKIQPDDILISLVGTIGKILILPENCEKGIINPRLIKVSLHKQNYLPQLFKYYFESAFLKSLYAISSHGATMDIINMGIIKDLPFPLCSLEEQVEIVNQIEKHFSIIDKLEATVQQSIKESKRLRQGILKQAFEGKLVEQDPNDQSAIVLLEKIAKAKEEYKKAQKKQARKK